MCGSSRSLERGPRGEDNSDGGDHDFLRRSHPTHPNCHINKAVAALIDEAEQASTEDEQTEELRAAYWVVAVLAWAGVAATLIITAFDGYAAPTYVEEGLFAGAAHGWAGAPERLINCLSYFTELSNIMVAIISTLLARRAVWVRGAGPRTCARS